MNKELAEESQSEMVSTHVQRKRILLSCFIGNAMEYYDFFLYGFMAPLVFDRIFFPKSTPLAGTLAVLGVFAVGYIARPVGGLIFAHLGDRYGRKPIMVTTLLLTGLATASIGLLPGAAQAGMLAPALLVLLRFLQGFGIGGESTGAPILAMENAPGARRGVFTSVVQMGTPVGSLAASLAVTIVARMPESQMLSWGWRVPFLLSGIWMLVGLYIRQKVAEAPVFIEALKKEGPKKLPIGDVFREEPRAAFTVLFSCLAIGATVNFFTVFGLIQALQVFHANRSLLLTGLTIGSAIAFFITPIVGLISDKIGRRPLIFLSFLLGAVYAAFGLFPLIKTGRPALVVLAFAISPAIIQPMAFAIEALYFAELFHNPLVRLSGSAFGRQLGGLVGGGLFPVAAAAVGGMFGGLPASIDYYLGIVAISMIGLFFAPETRPASIRPPEAQPAT